MILKILKILKKGIALSDLIVYNTNVPNGKSLKYRGVEQLVARRAHNSEAAGSSPVPATKNPHS